MDEVTDVTPAGAEDPGPGDAAAVDGDLVGLAEALEAAADLGPDERLGLLQRVEASISTALDGLDGL